jgi:response regulator RpfG family c-di-GMP phosphodiesterase
MMNVDTAAGRLPLVLVVDPAVSSRHALWRTLHRAFGVLEAESIASARTWLARRPDIDAVVVHSMLPDGRGEDLAGEWLAQSAPSKRAVVLTFTPSSPAAAHHGLTQVEPGDLRGVVEGLASWLSTRDPSQARLLRRDADSLFV